MKSFKISIYIFGVVVICSLIAVAGVLASVPGPGGPFSSAYRVQNLSTSATASCSYQFFDSAGSVAFTSATITIDPGKSDYVYVPSLTLNAGTYSGVVSCDQPVAAVVNFSDTNSGASHNGIASPATVWYAPGIYNNYYGYYSNMVVQNASGTGPVDITVEIFAPGSSVPAATQTASNVPSNASVSFDQTGLAGLSANIAYSAKITGTGAIAPITNIYGPGTTGNQLYSYNSFSSGSTTAYSPVIMNNYYGYNSALAVQNLGVASADVTIQYGTGQTKSLTIAANSSESLYTPASGVPAGSLTGATITSTQPIVALVNESNSYNRAASYSGFSTGGTTVVAPIVMKRYYNYNTSVTCQNVGAAATTMTLTYGGVTGSNTSPSIPNGGSHLFYQPTDSLISNNFIGSATITASEPIVCVANEDQNEGSLATTSMDQLYAYSCIMP